MKRRRVFASALATAVVGALFMFGGFGSPAVASGIANMTKIQQRLVSGFASYEMSAASARSAAPSSFKHVDGGAFPNYYPSADGDCPVTLGSNVKVNQNCLNISDGDLQGRGQAQNETAIAADPGNPSHVVASFNDYRRGDGNCGVAYSLDGGNSWSDTTTPSGFTRGTAFGGKARQYWQAGGDTAVAWDTKGNAYLQCQVFNRGAAVSNNPDQSSGIYVFRSTGNLGGSFNFTGRPVVEYNDSTGTGCCLEDKPLMAVDNNLGSPYQDRVYVTWTFFDADGTGYIYGAYSADYGETFSKPVLVSTNKNSLCPITYGLPTPHGKCNENQFSDPFVGSDGTLYVAYSNYNNDVKGEDNRNQILLTRSKDGGKTFSKPVKVTDYYDVPDCATYQGGADPGRACVPEKGSTTNSIFRATNYASGGVNPNDPSQIAVSVGSYINAYSNENNGCTPQGFAGDGLNLFDGVKTPGACNNKILISVSSDAGKSFTGTSTDPRDMAVVNQEPAQNGTDQFWQWAAFAQNGRFAVSYYDRQYGSDETTGYSDFSLSGSGDLSTFATVRVTSSSQAPESEFSGVFFGDYTGLTAVDVAIPIWMDTRSTDLFLCPGTGKKGVPPSVCVASAPNASLANDQDVFVSRVDVP